MTNFMEEAERNTYREIWSDFKKIYRLADTLTIGIIFFSVLLVIDYWDFPSHLLQAAAANHTAAVVIVVIIVSFVILLALSHHTWTTIRIKAINQIDFYLAITTIGMTLHFVLHCLLFGFKFYMTIEVILLLLHLDFMALRFARMVVSQMQNPSCTDTIVTLSSLSQAPMEPRSSFPIQISEQPSTQDLLNRTTIIQQLCQSIIHCHADSGYVISLEGDWGTGKTTILKLVREGLNQYNHQNGNPLVIEDFDPWLYGNPKALLVALYELLTNHTGSFSGPKSRQLLKNILTACVDTASEYSKLPALTTSIFSQNSLEALDLNELKAQIQSYTRINGKRLVLFIDNLDRTSEDNITFLFKLIDRVFDIPGVIYILAFDRNRIDKIFSETAETNNHFIEKIVQQEIKVPPISLLTKTQLYNSCIANLLQGYGRSSEYIEQLSHIQSYIIARTNTLRDFTRMLNSVFSIVFSQRTDLWIPDLLAIEAIHFYEPELYRTIQENEQYFTSLSLSPINPSTLNKEYFNKKGSDFFSSLSNKHPDGMTLLTFLFPYAKSVSDGHPLIYDHWDLDPNFDRNEIEQHCRICHAQYFPHYFDYGTNAYIQNNAIIGRILNELSHLTEVKVIYHLFDKNLLKLDDRAQKSWLEQFDYHIPDLPSKCYYNVVCALTDCIYKISDTQVFMSVSARTRATYIITKLLAQCTSQEFQQYLERMSGQYQFIDIISTIHNSFSSHSIKKIAGSDVLANQLIKFYNAMCEKILSDTIDLYSDTYYHRFNIWGLYRYCRESNRTNDAKKYIASIISRENIFRILWDITSILISDHYNYYINEEYLQSYIGGADAIMPYIPRQIPDNTDEAFVWKIYQQYVKHESDDWGHPIGINTNDPVELTL